MAYFKNRTPQDEPFKKELTACRFYGCNSFCAPSFANKTVDAPYVDKGDAYLEWKGGYQADHRSDVSGGWVQEGNFGYGITDFWNFEIGGAVDHDGASGGNTDFSTVTIDNRFEITPPGEYLFDFGVSLAYGMTQHDGPDGVEGKLLFAKEIGPFTNLGNIIIAREIGEDSSDETRYGLALGTSYQLDDKFAVGLEAYSDFGNFEANFDEQEHQVGPVLYGEFTDHLSYEVGVLGGVSDAAPDAEIKAIIGYGFKF